MIGQWVAPLLECGIGTALEALRSSGLERAPMTQALTADAMRRRAREFPCSAVRCSPPASAANAGLIRPHASSSCLIALHSPPR